MKRNLIGLLATVGIIGLFVTSECPAQTTAAKTAVKVEKDIVYATASGKELLLDAFLPKRVETMPAVLVVHGGAWKSGSKRQLAFYASALAERGYAAFAINYRLAPEHPFPAQIEDCRSAVRWIRKNAKKYHVDRKRIGAIGYSAGGHLVTLLGCTGTNDKLKDTRVQAVVAGGAPCDFRMVPESSRGLAFWFGGTRKELPNLYKAASPAAFVTAAAPPMFFFNGSDDRLVKPDSPRAMVEALTASKVEARLHVVENSGHIAAALNPDALTLAWKFLDKHLKPKGTVNK